MATCLFSLRKMQDLCHVWFDHSSCYFLTYLCVTVSSQASILSHVFHPHQHQLSASFSCIFLFPVIFRFVVTIDDQDARSGISRIQFAFSPANVAHIANWPREMGHYDPISRVYDLRLFPAALGSGTIRRDQSIVE